MVFFYCCYLYLIFFPQYRIVGILVWILVVDIYDIFRTYLQFKVAKYGQTLPYYTIMQWASTLALLILTLSRMTLSHRFSDILGNDDYWDHFDTFGGNFDFDTSFGFYTFKNDTFESVWVDAHSPWPLWVNYKKFEKKFHPNFGQKPLKCIWVPSLALKIHYFWAKLLMHFLNSKTPLCSKRSDRNL